MTPIPQEWIKEYVDQLLRVAGKLPKDGMMRASTMLRADNVMDMVKAFHDTERKDEDKQRQFKRIWPL